jgi:serine/threonine protein kinase
MDINQQFQEALDAFYRGEIEFAALEHKLLAALQFEPNLHKPLGKLLLKALKARRIHQQVYLTLNQHIQAAAEHIEKTQQGGQTEPAQTDGQVTSDAEDDADPDRTQISVRPAQTTEANEGVDDATIVHQGDTDESDGAEAVEDKTVLATGKAPATEEDGATRIIQHPGEPGTDYTDSNKQVTTGQTGQTGRIGTGTTGRTSNSSWGRPEDWSGDESELVVGDELKGRFILEAELGQGGMGTVFRALDMRKQEAQDRFPYVAIKVLNKEFKEHPESLKALQREAQKSQKLAHPNIITVFDFDRDGQHVYMTMELLEGQPMDKYIRSLKGVGLEKEKAFAYIKGMCNALAYAHSKNVVHSDFKPGNVFLTKDGNIKVLDFGIAQAAKQSEGASGEKTLFNAGDLGALTPAYASLEMLNGDDPAPQDDIYALACVSYELLAGKHPFNKKRANEALANGVQAERVSSLSKAQWRGLVRGLAFARKERSESVDVFLQESQAKPKFPVLLTGGIVGGVAALVFGVVWYQGYQHEQHIQQLVQDVGSQDSARVAGALDALSSLEEQEQGRVLDSAKDAIIDYYQKQIDYHIDDTQGRYSYPQAEALLEKASSLYTDSATLLTIAERVSERKAKLLEQLDKDFTRYIQTGQLLSDPDGQDINQVLHILAQVDPNDPRLRDDQRLAIAYEKFANQALEASQFEKADALLAAGLQRFPNRPAMLDLRDRIALAKATKAKNQRIAVLQTQLRTAAKQIKGLKDFAGVRDAIKQLIELQPGSKVVTAYRQRLQKLLPDELDKLIQDRRWEEGQNLLAEQDYLMSADFKQQWRQNLQQAEQQHAQNIQGAYDKLVQAAENRRLTLPKGRSAYALLKKLEDIGAGQSLLQQGQVIIADVYLQMSRELRMEKSWAEARKQIQKGLKYFPQGELGASLQEELAQIDLLEKQAEADLAEAERERIEQERLAKIAQYQQDFTAGLQAGEFNIKQARQQLQTLNRLATLAPEDTLVATGQARIAQRLDQQIEQLANQDGLDAALALTQEGLQLIPGMDVLNTRQRNLQKQLKVQQAELRGQRIAKQKAVIEKLVAQTDMDDKWHKALSKAFNDLNQLSTEESGYIAEQRLAAGQKILAKVEVLRDRQRFTDANKHLQWARSIGADTTAIQAGQAQLAEAQRVFNEQNQVEAERAEIEGLKRTLVTQAQANKVTAARKTLKSLQAKLPGQDEFIQQQAPEAIAKAYMRLAASSAKRKRYSSAEKLIKAGLQIAPEMAELQEALEAYQVEALYGEALNLVQAFQLKQNKKLVQKLKQLQVLDAANYPAKEAALAKAFIAHVKKLEKTDYQAADAMLGAGQKLFSAQKSIQQIKLVKPVPVKPEPEKPAVVAKPVETGKPQPIAKPTTPSKSRTVGADPCKSNFAGHGRRGRATCYDKLPNGTRGPRMVVIPGKGAMRAYAIGKYEVSVQDYNNYCKASGACKGLRGTSNNPASNISLKQANAYLAWLSQSTGFNYRLPKDSEWLHAATANSQQASKDYNCQLVVNGKTIKGLDLVAVNQGKPNKWGMVNHVGNVQEWAQTGSRITARGGQYKDSMADCDVSLSRTHQGTADASTGFRVLRELSKG